MKMSLQNKEQRIIDALNFLNTHKGYIKKGKSKIGEIVGLSGEELDELYNYVRELRKRYYDSSTGRDELAGYWIKTKHVSAYFKAKMGMDLNDLSVYVNELSKKIAPVNSKKYKNIVKRQGDHVAILNVYDVHIDKLPFNDKNHSVEDYVNSMVMGVVDMVERALVSFNIDVIIFPIGGDLFNTNGFTNTTKKGTPQKVLMEHDKAFKSGVNFCMNVINYLVSKGLTVKVPVIYGNHDHDVDFYLGTVMEVLYRDVDNVMVNNELVERKYYVYKNSLLGFGHGNIERRKVDQLPLIMATEEPDKWAITKFRTMYLGDIHHKQEYKFLKVKDYPGCTVSFLRSSSVMDKWHHDNMYIGVPRSMELHVYGAEKGNRCNFIYNL